MNVRVPGAVLCFALAAGGLRAEDPVALAPLQEDAVAKLFGPVERAAEFEEYAARAAVAKVPAQTITEARLTYGIRTRTLDARLEEAIRQLHALCEAHQWRKEDSRVCNTDAEVEGVLFFARALLAGRDGREDEYARCMKEAFWLNPSAGPVLAGELRVHREQADLLNLRVPMHKAIRTSAGESKTLDDLMAGKTALLLVFWTGGNDLSGELLDTLTVTTGRLERLKIGVVGINVQDLRGSAELERKRHDFKIPWLVDPPDRPLSRLLRVADTPRAVLVDPGGHVRYHGFPRAAALDSALRDLGADLSAD